MPEQEYTLTVDDKQVLDSLLRIGKAFDRMEKRGDDAMRKVSSSGSALGSVLGGVVQGAVQALTQAVIQLGAQAVAAFAGIIVSSQQAAAEFDVLRRQFIGIFKGQEDAADAIMDHIGQRASSLGLELREALGIGKAFIPDIIGEEDPLAILDDLFIAVRGLKEIDPLAGIKGARRAIEEAISGQTRSIQDIFEFTKTEITILRDAQKEFGATVGTIEGINRVLERQGVNVEALKGSFNQAVGEMEFAMGKLNIEMGKPIVEELTEALSRLGSIVADKSDDFELLAGAIGDVVALVVDFLSANVGDFLEQLDVEKLTEMTTTFGELVNQALVFGDILLDLEVSGGFVDQVIFISEKLTEMLVTINQIAAVVKATSAAAETLGGIGLGGLGLGGAVRLGRGLLGGGITEPEGGSAIDAFNDSLKESVEAMEEANRRTAESTSRTNERIAAQKKGTEAGLAEAEAFLKGAGAAGELTEEQQKLIEAMEKAAKKRLDLEKQSSREREKIARNRARDLEDIERRHQQSIDNLIKDQGRDEVQFARQQAQERIALERSATDRLIEIEKQFQRQIDDINLDLVRSKEDAEEAQNAIAFVQAIKRSERRVEDARTDREQAVRDTSEETEKRKSILAEQQEQERRQFEESQALKLVALQESLEQQLEEEKLAHQRRLEDQTIREQERLAKVQEALDEATQIEKDTGQEKLAVLDANMVAENRTVQERLDERLAIIRNFSDLAGNLLLPGTLGGSIPMAPLAGLQQGAPVDAGIPVVVGEGGRPELFIPSSAGRIIPNSRLSAFPAPSLGGGGNVTNNAFSPNFNLNNPAVLSPEQAIATQNIARQMAISVFNQLLQGR